MATAPGTLIGTLGYMAPEVLRCQPADQCADLFALGVMLYEMVCGRRPFERPSAADTISAVLNDAPPEDERLSGALERIVRECLAKDAAKRFHSAADLVSTLEALHNRTPPS